MNISEMVVDLDLNRMFGTEDEITPRAFIDYVAVFYHVSFESARDVLYRLIESGQVRLTNAYRVELLARREGLVPPDIITSEERQAALTAMDSATAYSRGGIIFGKIHGELDALIRLGWRPQRVEDPERGALLMPPVD